MPKRRKISIADKYYGDVKVENWPEDPDDIAAKLIAEDSSIKPKEPLKNRPALYIH